MLIGPYRTLLKRRTVAATPAYTGPGDIVSFTGWWGMRAYSAATAGTKAIRIKRASDNAETDINTLSDGTLDAATIATFIAATSGDVVKIYDKVSTNDLTTAGAIDLLPNAISTYYGCDFPGGSGNRFDSGNITRNQPFSVVTIMRSTTSVIRGIAALDNGGYAGWEVNANQSANEGIRQYAGANAEAAGAFPNNTWRALQFIVDGASSKTVSNGSSSTINPGAQNVSAYPLKWGGSSDGAFVGQGLEVGLYFGALDVTQIANLNTNMRAAYGSF